MEHIERSYIARMELHNLGFLPCWQTALDEKGTKRLITRYNNQKGKTVLLLEVTHSQPSKDSSYWDLFRPLDPSNRQQDTFAALADYMDDTRLSLLRELRMMVIQCVCGHNSGAGGIDFKKGCPRCMMAIEAIRKAGCHA